MFLGITLFAVLAVALAGGRKWISAQPAPPAADVSVTIRAASGSPYETTLLLENGEPVSLQVECRAPALAGWIPRLQWSCDTGRLEHREGVDTNRFFPPAKSAVSTIRVAVQFDPPDPRKAESAPALRKSAVLRVISPSSGSLVHNGVIDGFKLGDYISPRSPGVRKTTFVGLHPDKYQVPKAFYLVDDSSRDLKVSRHFRLGDFALDYPWFSLGKRQYIALDPGLLRKLEDLIEELKRAGLPGDSLRLIYGFRSPAYNLGRISQDGDESLKAPFSMHQYGKAADLILDADGDLRLDDLDHDGKVTVRDTIPIVHCVNALDRRYRSEGVPLFGGAGVYDHHDFWERPVQSPYVHIDVRGYLGEGGNLVRWPGTWPGTQDPIPWGKL